MGEGERETWTTEEFGSSHAGAVGVLLADGTVPAPVVFLNSSGSDSRSVSEWTIYDGEPHGGPRAAALRGVCSCAWTGPGHTIDWDEIADREAEVAGGGLASACYGDWDTHIGEVARWTRLTRRLVRKRPVRRSSTKAVTVWRKRRRCSG
ncbi:hypothetical protein [Streptomyces griseofuscus]|uniref:hypothetical protein n=1 Tax=Streptomyces griseofuscus TaxID=146922 RepID=UPI003452C8CF